MICNKMHKTALKVKKKTQKQRKSKKTQKNVPNGTFW